MSSLDYLDLCRLCLVKDRVSVPIFEGEGDVRQIFLKIAACLPVKVTREDKLPKKICDDCVYKVELFYQFWNTTANAEKQLLQWLGEVNIEDKQGYVTNVLNPNVMKQEQRPENRLDGNVMQQVGEHQNNMGMGMMDNMGLGIPMMISNANQQQQITSVPMDTSGNSVQPVQAVPGPSSQTTHNQISQNQSSSTQQEDEEESSEDEENSDDECDGDEGLPVKEESEEDPNNRTIEPTTFVNVSLACDEAGPSGLQQKISDIPEMPMPQTADGDPKTGERVCCKKMTTTGTSGHLDDKSVMDSMKSEENSKTLSTVSSKKENEEQHKNVQKTNYMGSLMHLCEVTIDSYTCDKCGIKFPVETMLNKHKIFHNFNSWLRKERLSNRNQFKISNKQNRQMKSQKLSEDQKYICMCCGFHCNRKASLTVHIKKEHKEISCIICDLKCNDYSILDKHMENHRNRRWMVFKCNACSFVSKMSSSLVSHLAQTHRKTDTKITLQKKNKKNDNKSKEKKESEKVYLKEEIKDAPSVSSSSDSDSKDESSSEVNKSPEKDSGRQQCDLCDFACSKKSTLYSHKRRHKVDIAEVYLCNECSFKTNKKSSLYSHIKRKHRPAKSLTADGQPQLFYCTQCEYKNKNKYELKVHFARKHTKDFKFSCEICGKKFKVKGDLTNHIRFSHKEQPVMCDVCGKTCPNSNSLYVHQKFAHYKAQYECHLCKRRMVTQENLNEHLIKQHENRKAVMCEECGKTFTRNSRLKVHMRVHTGDKPYTCTICSKSFARRTAMKQHLLIHTGVRPYVCDICGKAFTQKPGLISHRKSHPGSHPPLPRIFIDHILHDVMNK
ncbi:zinc finger protein 675-like isoform X1 [Osmia bicornis bicornis]|uniref:zinc finger protein 675-like isoform X1 n=1 Tax=Osmia bicornis bicornis TaxID=1437191 RepID=UPI001EAF1049|nr:zinc finger protein 675-like isoform X1 [Osmia bicornis bicornis]